jgi:hypothetical protein
MEINTNRDPETASHDYASYMRLMFEEITLRAVSGEPDACIVIEGLDGRTRSTAVEPKSLENAARAIADAHARRVTVTTRGIRLTGLRIFKLEADFSSWQYEGVANAVSLSASRSYLDRLPSGAVDATVSALKRGAVDLAASTGFISAGYAEWATAYERDAGLSAYEGRRMCSERLRGCFWANVLSRTHIEGLEKNGRSPQDAPAARVERLESEGWNGLVLCAKGATPWDTARRDLRSLEAFLAPILATRNALPDVR